MPRVLTNPPITKLEAKDIQTAQRLLRRYNKEKLADLPLEAIINGQSISIIKIALTQTADSTAGNRIKLEAIAKDFLKKTIETKNQQVIEVSIEDFFSNNQTKLSIAKELSIQDELKEENNNLFVKIILCEELKTKNTHLIKKSIREEIFPAFSRELINLENITTHEEYEFHDQELSIIELLLAKNQSEKDFIYIEIADNLVKLGAKLPQGITYSEENLNRYFQELIQDPRELFIAIHKEPTIINKQDEHGKTLLHHAADCAGKTEMKLIPLILKQLLYLPSINFEIRDQIILGFEPNKSEEEIDDKFLKPAGKTAFEIAEVLKKFQPITETIIYPEFLTAIQHQKDLNAKLTQTPSIVFQAISPHSARNPSSLVIQKTHL